MDVSSYRYYVTAIFWRDLEDAFKRYKMSRGLGMRTRIGPLQKMATATTTEESSSAFNITFNVSSLVAGVLGAWQEGDIYLRLSAVGAVVLVALCLLICLAWLYYGSVVSSVFDGRNKAGFQQQFSEEKLGDQPIIRSASYFMPWQGGAFHLSPETRKIDEATKKQN